MGGTESASAPLPHDPRGGLVSSGEVAHPAMPPGSTHLPPHIREGCRFIFLSMSQEHPKREAVVTSPHGPCTAPFTRAPPPAPGPSLLFRLPSWETLSLLWFPQLPFPLPTRVWALGCAVYCPFSSSFHLAGSSSHCFPHSYPHHPPGKSYPRFWTHAGGCACACVWTKQHSNIVKR